MICFLADKYLLRNSIPSDEAALPHSKQRHWAQEAMSACVEAATALVEPVATSVTGQNDAYKISVDENLILNSWILTRSQLREIRNVSK